MDKKEFETSEGNPLTQLRTEDPPPTYDAAVYDPYKGVSTAPSAPAVPIVLPAIETLPVNNPVPPGDVPLPPGDVPDAEAGQTEDEESKDTTEKKTYSCSLICMVYGLLIGQVFLAIGIISLYTIEEVKRWTYFNEWIFYLSVAVFLVCLVLLGCCNCIKHKTPINVICLIIFTAAFAVMIGTKVFRFDNSVILHGLEICGGIIPFLIIFSFIFLIDPKVTGGWYCSVVTIPVVGVGCIIFMPEDQRLIIAYYIVGSLAYATYIAYFLHVSLGLPLRGKYKYYGYRYIHYGYYPGHMSMYRSNMGGGGGGQNMLPEANYVPT